MKHSADEPRDSGRAAAVPETLPEDDIKLALASRNLAVLEGQARALRIESVRLRRDVNLAQRNLDNARRDLARVRTELVPAQQRLADLQQLSANLEETQTQLQAHLYKVNEQLVLAALTSHSLAKSAQQDLDELARISQRDPLTDTPNRALMLDRIESAIAFAKRHETRIAILFIDFDRFKQINDTLGHDVGDAALQLVARRMESAVRSSDTVSRHSGDEFLVLLGEVGDVADAASAAEKIIAAVGEPAVIGKYNLQFSVSVGIALYPDDGDDAATLIKKADVAMYRSKRRGGDTFELHS